jgi:hypothetical protein
VAARCRRSSSIELSRRPPQPLSACSLRGTASSCLLDHTAALGSRKGRCRHRRRCSVHSCHRNRLTRIDRHHYRGQWRCRCRCRCRSWSRPFSPHALRRVTQQPTAAPQQPHSNPTATPQHASCSSGCPARMCVVGGFCRYSLRPGSLHLSVIRTLDAMLRSAIRYRCRKQRGRDETEKRRGKATRVRSCR